VALFEHTLTSGQSLSVGAQYAPEEAGFSTVSEAANAKTVVAGYGGQAAHQIAAGGRQRPDLSMGYRIAQADTSRNWGFTTCGQGGATIAQLAKGTTQYTNMVNTVTAEKANRVAAGDTYKIRAFHWIQGESDQRDGMTADAYKAAVLQLRADYNTDLMPISGQADQFPWILSQVGTWPYYSIPPAIPLAQVDMARTVPGMYVVGGQYQLEYHDELHPTARGYYHLGELHARAHQAVISGAGWAPFAPTSYAVTDTGVDITYHTPTGALVLDTATVPAQPNMGFSLQGTSAQITGVALTGPSTLRLSTDRRITEQGAKVGYGVTNTGSPRGLGNLRDSDPGVSAYDATPLRNWALQTLDALTVPIVKPAHKFTITDMYARKGGLLLKLSKN
jgi:hypothetical protein